MMYFVFSDEWFELNYIFSHIWCFMCPVFCKLKYTFLYMLCKMSTIITVIVMTFFWLNVRVDILLAEITWMTASFHYEVRFWLRKLI